MINLNKKNNKFFLNYKDIFSKTSEGFSLVETLVALFIFSVTILTVMSVFSQGVTSTNYAKNKIVASYLSQEGIEYFRNMRDTFMLYEDDKTGAWSKFIEKLSNAGCSGDGCYFDNNSDNLFPNGIKQVEMYSCGENCPNFYYNTQSGKYGYEANGSETTFSRKMRLQLIDENNIKITSEVIFTKGANTGTIILSENLSNWIE